MFMVLAWVYNSSMIIKSCVYEKEQRLKEVMKVMGLSNGVHWVGWFIESFIMMFITIVLLDIILVVSASTSPITFFPLSHCILFRWVSFFSTEKCWKTLIRSSYSCFCSATCSLQSPRVS